MSKTFPLVALLASAASLVPAQKVTVYATGLKNPTQIIQTPGGNLLVTETDTPINSGRVSRISSGGAVHPLMTGLPSGPSIPANDPDGPSGIILAGQVLYIEIGEGDGFVNGPNQGQMVPNPAGGSSPIFASIMKVTFSASPDLIGGTFALTADNQSDLSLGKVVTLTDGSGDTATCEMLTQLRQGIPDPVTLWRHSHPYAMTSLASQPNYFYIADAGRNLVWQVDNSTGKTIALAEFASTPDPVAGPPVIEAVPDNIRPYGNQLLVALLSGAPFVGGQSRVVQVDPATGAQSVFIADLTSTIDVGVVPVPNARPIFYTLQYSSSLTTGAPGQLIRYDGPLGKIYADGLKGPTSMTIDSSGNIYIAEHDGGDIVLVTPQ